MVLNDQFRASVAFLMTVIRRGLVAALLATTVLASCTDKRPSLSSVGSSEPAAAVDDVSDDGDDEEEMDELFIDEPMPQAAEELFDDFFFNFATNRKVQLERIAFTPRSDGGNLENDADTTSAESLWHMDRFFMNQDYYTVIFDRPEFMDFVKDTAVSEAVVEKIDFRESMVNQYEFDRHDGRWMLRQVKRQSIAENPNASFLQFYHRFVTDSAFQHESLADEIVFRGSDPDDEFSELEGLITPDFWDAFAPELPRHLIYNIVYDRHQDAATSQKIFLLRGISNGSELEITFQKEKNEWKLKKLME